MNHFDNDYHFLNYDYIDNEYQCQYFFFFLKIPCFLLPFS